MTKFVLLIADRDGNQRMWTDAMVLMPKHWSVYFLDYVLRLLEYYILMQNWTEEDKCED